MVTAKRYYDNRYRSLGQVELPSAQVEPGLTASTKSNLQTFILLLIFSLIYFPSGFPFFVVFGLFLPLIWHNPVNLEFHGYVNTSMC